MGERERERERMILLIPSTPAENKGSNFVSA